MSDMSGVPLIYIFTNKEINTNIELYYDILKNVVNIVMLKKDENLIDEYEIKLSKLNDNFKLRKYENIFMRYLYLYIFIKNELLKLKKKIINVFDVFYEDLFTSNLQTLYKYYNNQTSQFILSTIALSEFNFKCSELLFTCMFDYTYIHVKNYTTDDVNEIYENVLNVDLNKKCSENFNREYEIDKMKTYSSFLFDFFRDTKKYSITHLDVKLTKDEKDTVKSFIRVIQQHAYIDNTEYTKEQLYNICSDDFLFESVNEKKISEYVSSVAVKIFKQNYIKDIQKYTDMKIDELLIENLESTHITQNEKYMCHLCTYISGEEVAHALLLISEYINDEYNIFLFCPNGIADLFYYSNDISSMQKRLISKINKKINFVHSTLINQKLLEDITLYKDISHVDYKHIEQGYLNNVQSIVSSHSIKYKRVQTKYGTCFMWCCLFMETYLKLKKLANATPLNVYRYIIKKYNNPLKLARVIDDYIVYYMNDKYTVEDKNKLLDDYKYVHCKKLTDAEYVEQFLNYCKPTGKSPIYDKELLEHLKNVNISDNYFLLPYKNDNSNLYLHTNISKEYNCINQNHVNKYLNILHDKYNVYVIDNDKFINDIYTINETKEEILNKFLFQLTNSMIYIHVPDIGLFLIKLYVSLKLPKILLFALYDDSKRKEMTKINNDADAITFKEHDLKIVQLMIIDLFIKTHTELINKNLQVDDYKKEMQNTIINKLIYIYENINIIEKKFCSYIEQIV